VITGFEIAVAQVSEDKSGFLGVQVDGLGTGAKLGTFPLHHAFGFWSRPRDPDSSGLGCGVQVGYEGGRGHAWLLEDPRYLSSLPAASQGGSLQYAVTAAGLVAYLSLSGDDGSATLATPGAALVNLGGTGGDSVALATELQRWADILTNGPLGVQAASLLGLIVTAINAIVPGAITILPGTPAWPALGPNVASTKVKAL
jgi:hypothetical protein